MKNGFGLKYIHRFLNMPYLLLQVKLETHKHLVSHKRFVYRVDWSGLEINPFTPKFGKICSEVVTIRSTDHELSKYILPTF